MSKIIKLTESDLVRIVKKVISEQAAQPTPTPAVKPSIDENSLKSCMDATYGKGRFLGKTPQGGFSYQKSGTTYVFYLNLRYIMDSREKGSFSCSSGKAVLTPGPWSKNENPPTAKPTSSTSDDGVMSGVSR